MTFRNKYSTFWHQSPTSVYAIDWACCIACFAYLCLRGLSQSGPFAERGGDQEGHQALGRSRSKLTLRGHVVVKKIQLPTWVKGILRRHAKSICTIYDITWNKCESSSWFFWTPFLPCTMEATLMWHEFYGGARRGWYRSVRVTWRKTTHFVSFCHLHFFGVTETAWLRAGADSWMCFCWCFGSAEIWNPTGFRMPPIEYPTVRPNGSDFTLPSSLYWSLYWNFRNMPKLTPFWILNLSERWWLSTHKINPGCICQRSNLALQKGENRVEVHVERGCACEVVSFFLRVCTWRFDASAPTNSKPGSFLKHVILNRSFGQEFQFNCPQKPKFWKPISPFRNQYQTLSRNQEVQCPSSKTQRPLIPKPTSSLKFRRQYHRFRIKRENISHQMQICNSDILG